MTGIIEELSNSSFDECLRMGLLLWVDHEKNDLKKIFEEIKNSSKEKTFVYKINGKYIGFINVSIRVDYVEGSNSTPVGYVEGIYVDLDFRKKGVAKELVKKGEEWAYKKGCKQMGSDILLNNTISYDFHKNIGFTEANKIICFIKDIAIDNT
jgi:aminoglycoside 6'-N-acetyltransferase I